MLPGLSAWGGFLTDKLPLDASPDVTNNQVQVITQSASLAAEKVGASHYGAAGIATAHRAGRDKNPLLALRAAGDYRRFTDNVSTPQTRQLAAEKLP